MPTNIKRNVKHTKKSIIIRECKSDDLSQVIEMQKKWTKEEITFGYIPGSIEYLQTKLGEYFIIAESNDELIGYVFGTIHKSKNMAIMNDGESYLEIDDIYTISGIRGNGIGSILLEKILDVAKENGVERSLIYSATKDMEGISKFYKKHGYSTWNIQMFK